MGPGDRERRAGYDGRGPDKPKTLYKTAFLLTMNSIIFSLLFLNTLVNIFPTLNNISFENIYYILTVSEFHKIAIPKHGIIHQIQLRKLHHQPPKQKELNQS